MADNKDEKKTAPQQEQEVKEEVKEETKSAEVPEETKDEEKDKKSKKDEKKADKKEEKKPSQADELKTANDKYLRLMAEYDNYRKRSQREADQKFNDGVSHAVTQILGILDTLNMAANAACTADNYKKGVMMTLDKAGQALEKLNITEIEAQDQPFDPNLMNAVQQVPPQDGQESGTVVQVFQKGYKIGDKIIRHATVVVAE